MTAMTEEIQKLSKRFLKMYPVKDIDLKLMMNNLSKLDYDDSMEYQEKLLRSTIHHPIVQKYPPTILYRQRFLKRLITEIEDINLEVIDSLYKAYTNLLSQENRNTENSGSISYCYKTYCLAPELTITLKETQNIISEGTTGMFTWQSDGFSIPYKDTRVSVKRLDWTSDHVQSSCDIVLAADVVYDTEIIFPLVLILKEALGKSDGATAYVASTIRNQDTFNCFRNALVSNNVKVKSESHHAYQESPSQQKSFIIIMKLML
ncbi:uncharacterized protein LOC135223706 isoform X4 [Macrobrachium nipponense]|uniref:uncharacterized protein LOC135223706 isoform X4 n=1 Tax=Macrobrachium nipponense TaxID=159736 RepID=UPI0030C813D2